MNLHDVMKEKVFAIAGDTLNPEKYAYKIKAQMAERGYSVYGIGRERASFNDVPEDIDVIDLCINPPRGLKLLQENRKQVKCVVIQPGAGSPEIEAFLADAGVPYIDGCLLVGLTLY